MSSKARFHSKSHASNSKASQSASGAGTSKALPGKQQTSGGAAKPSQIQVIFNGKITTPQSLLPRREANVHQMKKSKGQGRDVNIAPTIDEADSPDKATAIKNQKNKVNMGTLFKSAAINDMASSRAKMNQQKQLEEEHCTIRLSETETTIQFAMTSYIIPSDTREVKELEEKNARYDAVVLAHRNSDNYVSHPTQTMNNPLKNQNDMIAPNAVQDFECQVDPYDIKDTVAMDKTKTVDQDISSNQHHVASKSMGTDPIDFDNVTGFSISVRKFISDTVSISSVSPGCLLDPSELTKPRNPADSNKEGKPRDTSRNRTGRSRVLDHSRGDDGVSKSYAVETGRSGAGNSDYHVGGVSNDGRSSGNVDDKGRDAPERSSEISGLVSDNNAGTGMSYHGGASAVVIQQNTEELLRERQAQETLSAPMLLKRLQMLERAAQQNAYHRYHLDYRDLPDLVPLSLVDSNEIDSKDGKDQLFSSFGGLVLNKRYNAQPISDTNSSGQASSSAGENAVSAGQEEQLLQSADNHAIKGQVKLLFRYSNDDLVQGRAVTAMAWNAVNSDLLAVGYGKLDTFVDEYQPGAAVDEELAGGLVLFWSLRNPDYPEKILRTPYPVTALEFSKLSPMILAVGLMNGDVSVYDVKREFNWTKPIESSANIHAGHADPVWQVKWVVKGIERVETLVSISTDGSVLEWNLKKGLVVTTLMQLKRSGAVEGWISRNAAGLSFDFVPGDPNTYIVGTEEGAIHRCSVSYNEQYLDSYLGHDGPVYRLRFSSRWPQLFITAGADWMIHLYHMNIKTPLLSLRTTNEDFAINDVAWCPGNSTIFAAVTASGKLEIWDLSISSIDPVALVDTTKDDEAYIAAALASIATDSSIPVPLSPTSPSPATAKHDHTALFDSTSSTKTTSQQKESSLQQQPVAKLLKNLAAMKSMRELTCVQFGERSPTLAVGDNRGSVMVYRVLAPQTITHEGPMQQTLKLKAAISKQVDPSTSLKLAALDNPNMMREDSTSPAMNMLADLPPPPPSSDNIVE